MFTFMYYVLIWIRDGELSNEDRIEVIKAIKSIENKDKTFRPEPDSTSKHFSHDNLTVLVCISLILDISFHKNANRGMFQSGWDGIKPLRPKIHPRDIVFYEFCHGGWRRFIARFFLWIPAIIMIISCLQSYKVRGEKVKIWWKFYYTKNKRKIVKTDGKILALIRCRATMNISWTMKLTWHICDFIILAKKKYFGSWTNVFGRYFKLSDHPGFTHPNHWVPEQIFGKTGNTW